MFAHSVARFRNVENALDFALFKADYILVVLLGHGQFCGYVAGNAVVIEKVFEKRADGGDFSRFTFFSVCVLASAVLEEGQILHKRFEIAQSDFVQVFDGELADVFIVLERADVFEQIIEKNVQIVGII